MLDTKFTLDEELYSRLFPVGYELRSRGYDLRWEHDSDAVLISLNDPVIPCQISVSESFQLIGLTQSVDIIISPTSY